MKIASLILILLAIVPAGADAKSACPDNVDGPLLTLYHFSKGNTMDAAAIARAKAVPAQVDVSFVPGTKTDGAGNVYEVCFYTVEIDMMLDRAFSDIVSESLTSRNDCETVVTAGISKWDVNGPNEATGTLDVRAKLKECTSHWWVECNWLRCEKTRYIHKIHKGNAKAQYLVPIDAELREETAAYVVGTVRRGSPAEVEGPGIFSWADVPNWLVDFMVDGTIESLFDDGVNYANFDIKSSVAGPLPCLHSGGYKGGAKVCIVDPLDPKKKNYPFATPTFRIDTGLWSKVSAQMSCTPRRCPKIREFFQETNVFARDAPGGTHLVSVNDSLWDISEQRYGAGRHWNAVASINALRGDAPVLQPGMELYLPRPSELYDKDSPSVMLRGSSLWSEWSSAKLQCPPNSVRMNWEEFTSDLRPDGRTYQGERPQPCKPVAGR